MFDIIENRDEHLIFRHAKCRRIAILVRAVVNNTVHIKIQIVEFGYPILCDQDRDRRIPLAQPAKEFRNTHGESKGNGNAYTLTEQEDISFSFVRSSVRPSVVVLVNVSRCPGSMKSPKFASEYSRKRLCGRRQESGYRRERTGQNWQQQKQKRKSPDQTKRKGRV